MKTAEFDYALPEELIAQHPLPERSASRLLHLDASGAIDDLRFADLPGLIAPTDLLVLNNTRVVKARLFGHKQTGGRIEVFVERIVGMLFLLAAPLTVGIMIDEYTSYESLSPILIATYPVLQPVSRALLGYWIWTQARVEGPQ